MKNYIYDIYDKTRALIEPVYLRNQSERTKAILAVVIVCFFWGTTWLASKRGVQHMPALQLAGIRQLIAGTIYLVFFFIRGHVLPSRKQIIQFAWMSILMIVINNGFSTWSMKFIPSGLGAVIGAASPLWIALLSAFVFKETKINLVTAMGLILGLSGILVIFSDYLNDLFNWSFFPGILLNVIASVAWSFGTIYTVRNAKKVDPYFSLGWQMFIGGTIMLLIAKSTNQHIALRQIPLQAWTAIAYLVIIGSIVTYSAFIYALKRLPAPQVSIYAYINPIVAIIIGAILNNEKLSLIVAVGTMVTLSGIYLVNTGFKKSKRI